MMADAFAALTALEFSAEPTSLAEALDHIRRRREVIEAVEAMRSSSVAAEMALVTLRLHLADEDADCFDDSHPFDASALAFLWAFAEGAPELWPDAATLVANAPGVLWARRFACSGPSA